MMAKSVPDVIEDLRTLLNKSGKDVLTLSWAQFYALSERERIKDGFTEEVVKIAKVESLLVCFGNAAVLVAKDYKFSPCK